MNTEKNEFSKPAPEELKKNLSTMQYNVTQKSETEPPFVT